MGAPFNKLQYGHRQKAVQQIELKYKKSVAIRITTMWISRTYDDGRKPEGIA